MKKNKPSKELPNAKVMLQARLIYRDRNGETSDVTQDENDYGFGLKSLERMGSDAMDELIRINELLEVLALAAEKRPVVDARLILRIIEEVQTESQESAELAAYVRSTKELFEQAETLPPLNGPGGRKTRRSLTLLKSAS